MDDFLRILSKSEALQRRLGDLSIQDFNSFTRHRRSIEDWLEVKKTPAKGYIQNVMNRFGLSSRYDDAPGSEGDRGQFFLVRYTEAGDVELIPASEDHLYAAGTIVCFGIDTSGQKYLKSYLNDAKPLIKTTDSDPVLVYHYHTPPQTPGRVCR